MCTYRKEKDGGVDHPKKNPKPRKLLKSHNPLKQRRNTVHAAISVGQEWAVDRPVTLVPSPPSLAVLQDPGLAWVSLPGPAACRLVSQVS